MICVHCGKEIDNGQAFCPYCGSRVGGDAAPEAKAAKKDPRKLACRWRPWLCWRSSA